MSASVMKHSNLDTKEEITAYVQNRHDLYRSKGIRDDPL